MTVYFSNTCSHRSVTSGNLLKKSCMQFLVGNIISHYIISCYIISHYIISHYIISCYIISHYIISHYIISCYIISQYVISQYIISHYIISHYIISHYIISHYIISRYIISCYIISHYIISHYIISHYIISCYIISHYIISHYIISHYIILYHIILYHVILYHVILYHIILYHVISILYHDSIFQNNTVKLYIINCDFSRSSCQNRTKSCTRTFPSSSQNDGSRKSQKRCLWPSTPRPIKRNKNVNRNRVSMTLMRTVSRSLVMSGEFYSINQSISLFQTRICMSITLKIYGNNKIK